MRYLVFILILASAMVYSCSNGGTEKETATAKEYEPLVIAPEYVKSIVLNDTTSQWFLANGRKIAGKTKLALKQELKKAIRTGGIEYAVEFCNTRAMEITDSISLAENVMIRRLAKKNRNPYNATTEEEDNIIKSYAINHMNKTTMNSLVTWDEQGRPVYYNPIIVEAACLNCHGTVGKEVDPEIAKKIVQLYPEDKATNFKLGDLRGMWAITFPEYMVVAAE